MEAHRNQQKKGISSSSSRNIGSRPGVRPDTPKSPLVRVSLVASVSSILSSTPVAVPWALAGPFVCTSGAAAPVIFFITLGGILDLRTFPRPGSSEALSIGPGAAARDSRAAAIDRRRDLLDMSNFASA